MSIVSVLKDIAKKSTTLRVLMRNTMYTSKKVLYFWKGIGVKPDEKTVVFSAYNGRSYVCSPKAVYEYMLHQEEYADYRFIWLFDHPEKYQHLMEHPNTIVVKNGSSQCEKYLHQSKYWIFNFRAYDHWIPKKSQVYVQCWHGTPLKRLGYDITNSDNAMNSVKEIREKYRTDALRFSYILSPCRFVTETFASAWNLKKTGKEAAILETGYPRNDFLNDFSQEDVLRIRENIGLKDETRKIILYAPTWRDNQYDSKKGYVYDNPVDFAYLREQLGKDYVILFRAHYLVADQFDFEQYKDFVLDVSKYDDINELYVVSDLLITDYSSVFFDYAILKRPMLFYMYDMEAYRDEMRGFYLDIHDLPGPIVKTEAELAGAVCAASVAGADMESIETFNQEYNLMNDGNAAMRFVEKIF